MKCTNGLGYAEHHDAEGWLCAPNGKRISAMCHAHAMRVIREYADKLNEQWTFAEEAGP